MPKKRITDYSPVEIQQIKETVINSALYGLSIKQAATLIGLTVNQLDHLMDSDETFKTEYQTKRQEGIKNMSVQMHNLAQKGNYQALAFLLSRDENSPYNDEAIKDPKTQGALEMIIAHLIEHGGLLPPAQLQCPNCGCQLIEDRGQLIKVKVESPNISLN